MRRSGRYPLAVMAWIAVYAGWSSVLGLLIAAVTGESLDDGDRVGPTVGLGVSTLFTVILPLVPTLVALWFNDWLRDGAPSRADRQRAARRAAASTPGRAVAGTAVEHAQAGQPAQTSKRTVPVPEESSGRRRPGVAPSSAPVVEPAPLGVPELADAAAPTSGFPVAPVLRARDDAARPGDAPVIDPEDPLGVSGLRLPGVGGRDESLGV